MRFFLLSACFVGTIVWLGIHEVTQRSAIDALSFAVNDAYKIQLELEDQLHQLEINHSRLLDPKKLVDKAQKAGFRTAPPETIVEVKLPARRRSK